MQPSLILWDIGNVIVLADHEITFSVLRKYGVSAENARKFFTNEDYTRFARGWITGEGFYNALIEKYLKPRTNEPPLYQQIVDAHDWHMHGIDGGVVKILDQLAAKKQQQAFFTNTVAWQTRRERVLIDVGNYSNHVFRSDEIGMIKTDEDAFPYVISQLGVPAEQIFFIDDSKENVEVARKYGLMAHQFKDAVGLENALKEEKLLEE